MATPPLLTDSDTVAIHDGTTSTDAEIEPLAPCHPDNPEQPAPFGFITENVYISPALHVSKERKRAKRMVCDCQFDPEMDEPDEACGENCLNRVLMIECGSRCPCGEYCTNKRFQRADYADVEVFKTTKKGWGLRACKDISRGEFVMEYCGEVCTLADFEQRKVAYIKEKRRHYYFMSLRTDEILDATRKGNHSRFINHSCDPNCETQKWTVGGRLRIGFFTIKNVKENEEFTFDYKFERFGDQAQKCFCGSDNCRGYIGQSKQSSNSLKVVGPSARDLGSPQSPREKRRGRVQRLMSDADNAFEKEVYSIVGSCWRLRDSVQVLALSRIMLQAETTSQRSMLLQVLLATRDSGCLKKFLSLQGLKLLWSWMIDSGDRDTDDVISFRIQMLRVLDYLPLTTKNQLEENKLLPVVKRWREKPPVKLEVKPSHPSSHKATNYSVPDENFEGTVVTEADSGLCEGDVNESSEVISDPIIGSEFDAEKMEESCEAEARYLTSDHSQDEGEHELEKGQRLMSSVYLTAPSNDGEDSTGPEMSPDYSHQESPPGILQSEGQNLPLESIEENSERHTGPQVNSKAEESSTKRGPQVLEENRSGVVCETQVYHEQALSQNELCNLPDNHLDTQDPLTLSSCQKVENLDSQDQGDNLCTDNALTEDCETPDSMKDQCGELSQYEHPEGRRLSQDERSESSKMAEPKVQELLSDEELRFSKDEKFRKGFFQEIDQGSSQDVETKGLSQEAEPQCKGSPLEAESEGQDLCQVGEIEQQVLSQEAEPEEHETAQDEEPVGREMLAMLADKLVEKWEGLKEVFRIPKRAPVLKTHIPDKEDSSNEGDGSEEALEPPRKRVRSRKSSPERTWSRSRHRSPLLHSRHSTHSHSRPRTSRRQTNYTPSTPPQPHTPPLYSSGYSTSAPVQNTVIVQHPGHSVYVQQQVFKGSCQTTILPAPYLNTTTPSSQYVQVQQSPGGIVHPTQQGAGILVPPIQQSSGLIVSQPQQGAGSIVPPTQQGSMLPQTHQGPYYPSTHLNLGVAAGSAQQEASPTPVKQGLSVYNIPQPLSLLTQQPTQILAPGLSQQQQQYTGYQTAGGVVRQSGTLPLLQTGGQQQYVQYTNSSQVYVPSQSVTTQPKPLLEINLSSSAATQASALSLAPLPPPPPEENSLDLPQNWKAATDQSGKMYYYHVITRKTQWERPTEKDVEGTITMDLGTPEPESGSDQEETELKGPCTPTDNHQPHTPDETPPLSQLHSATGPHTPTTSPQPHTPTSSTPTSPTPHTPTNKALDSSVQSEDDLSSSPLEPHSAHSSLDPVIVPALGNPPTGSSMSPSLVKASLPSPGSPGIEFHSPELDFSILEKKHSPHKKRKKSRAKENSLKDEFRHNVTKLVTHCLDQHRKPDCKYGRITCVEDFKHLARKLSHGLTEKEIARKGGVDKVELTDSVRSKVKEYIRLYMKKFGSVYVRHRSPI